MTVLRGQTSEGEFAVWHWQVYRRIGEAILEQVPGGVPDPAYERLPLAPGGRDATGLLESAFRLENLVVSGAERMRLDRAVEAGVAIGALVQVRRDDLGIPLRRDRFPVPVPLADDVIGADAEAVLAGLHAAMEQHAPKHPGGVRLDCVAAAGVMELTARPWSDQEGWVPWAPPAEISQWLHRLRTMTYTPGRGAWFSVSYVIAPGQEPTIAYDYATRPVFEVSHVAPRCWHDELRLLPRTPEATPDWLLGEAWRHHQLLADAVEAPRPLRLAREFDGVDTTTGRPYTCRPVIGHLESGQVRYYLSNAPVSVEAEDPDARHHTDGVWVWPASMALHMEQGGLVPPLELLDHIRGVGYEPPTELSEDLLRAAAALAPSRPAAKQDDPPTAVQDDGGAERAMAEVREWLRTGTEHDMTVGPHAVDVDIAARSPEGWTVSYNRVTYLASRDPQDAMVPAMAIVLRERDGSLRWAPVRPGGPSHPVPDRRRETWAEELDPSFEHSGVAYLGIPDQAVRAWRRFLPEGTVGTETRPNPAAEPGPVERGFPPMTTQLDHLLSYLAIGWFSREQFLLGLLRAELLIPVDPATDSPPGSLWLERPRRLKAYSSRGHLPPGTARCQVLDGVAFRQTFAGVGLSINPGGRPVGEVTAEDLAATHAAWPHFSARVNRFEDCIERA